MGTVSGEPTNATLRAALAAYELADGDEERSTACRLLREELGRRAIARDVAFRRQMDFLQKVYEREVHDLEKKLQRKLQKEEISAAVEQALMKIFITIPEDDPEAIKLYAGVIEAFSVTKNDYELPGLVMSALQFLGAVRKGKAVGPLKASAGNLPRVGKSVYRCTQAQLKDLSKQVHASLASDGVEIPPEKLTSAILEHVKVANARRSKIKQLKDRLGEAALGITLVTAASSVLKDSTIMTEALTRVNSVKVVPPLSDVLQEPLLSTRHFVPDGWFF